MQLGVFKSRNEMFSERIWTNFARTWRLMNSSRGKREILCLGGKEHLSGDI